MGGASKMGQLCDSVNSMPIEERNELNTLALQDIYGSIDNLVDAVNNSDNGVYLNEINQNLIRLETRLKQIADSLRVISHNTE